MKKMWNRLVLGVLKIDRSKLQLIVFVVLLVLMVLAAGAPEDGGSLIRAKSAFVTFLK